MPALCRGMSCGHQPSQPGVAGKQGWHGQQRLPPAGAARSGACPAMEGPPHGSLWDQAAHGQGLRRDTRQGTASPRNPPAPKAALLLLRAKSSMSCCYKSMASSRHPHKHKSAARARHTAVSQEWAFPTSLDELQFILASRQQEKPENAVPALSVLLRGFKAHSQLGCGSPAGPVQPQDHCPQPAAAPVPQGTTTSASTGPCHTDGDTAPQGALRQHAEWPETHLHEPSGCPRLCLGYRPPRLQEQPALTRHHVPSQGRNTRSFRSRNLAHRSPGTLAAAGGQDRQGGQRALPPVCPA